MIISSTSKVESLPEPTLGLLPAVHFADPTSTAILPASPSLKTVYYNSGDAPITIPAYLKWPSRQIPVGNYFAYDGRLFYPVVNKQGTTSYYPKDFERIIYTISHDRYTLPIKQSFTFERLFYLRLFANNVLATWSIIFEFGIRDDDVSPEVVLTRTSALTSGSKVLSLTNVDGIKLGMFVTGDGIYNELDASSFVVSISGQQVTLNRSVSLTGNKEIVFKSSPGPNIGLVKWFPPAMEFTASLTDLKSANPLGIVITNHGEKAGDPARNDAGFGAFVKLFQRAVAAPIDSLPTRDSFYFRLRIGNFDTENSVADPKGYAAYVIRDIADPEDN